MRVQVRAFANFREILGRDLQIELKDEATVRDLLDHLSASHQRLKPALFDESGRVREYVILMKNRRDIASMRGIKTTLTEGDEVAILPPVAGG